MLICDLDGTLVDSFPGIASALRTACIAIGLTPAVPIDRSLVGPPLDDILQVVGGTTDPNSLEHLRQAFVAAYDDGACLLSSPFEGVEEMLAVTRQRGHSLSLATNKRLVPTQRIIEALGWSGMFDCIETIDSRAGKDRPKYLMLRDVCHSASCEPRAAFYLGDMEADIEAAKSAGTNSILAAWGAPKTGVVADLVAETPMNVIAFLERHKIDKWKSI